MVYCFMGSFGDAISSWKAAMAAQGVNGGELLASCPGISETDLSLCVYADDVDHTLVAEPAEELT